MPHSARRSIGHLAATGGVRMRVDQDARRRIRRATDVESADPRPADVTSSTNPAPPKPTASGSGGARDAVVVSLLLGVAVAMTATGLVMKFHDVWSGPIAYDGIVIGLVLVALAVGVRLPQRFGTWMCSLAWRRSANGYERAGFSATLLSPAQADRPLQWMALAVITLAAGVATGLLPIGVRMGETAHAWMLARFVWSPVPLVLLRAVTVFAVGLVPLALLGLAISFAHRLHCRMGRWDAQASTWLLVGAAGGSLIGLGMGRLVGRGELILCSAAIPTLLVALFSAWPRSSSLHDNADAQDADAFARPLFSDLWPTLLRAEIVAVGAISVCLLSLWVGSVHLSVLGVPVTVPLMLLALGGGFLAGCRRTRAGLRSVGGFGMACLAAGVTVAGASIALIQAPWTSASPTAAVACTTLAAIGFAMAYGRQTLLHRVASRSATGATVLARTLVCAGVCVAVVAPLAEHLLGKVASLVMLALSLVALGGILIIHDPLSSTRTRRLRLVAVFGTITAMIVAALAPSNPWQRKRSAPPRSFRSAGVVDRDTPPTNRTADPFLYGR